MGRDLLVLCCFEMYVACFCLRRLIIRMVLRMIQCDMYQIGCVEVNDKNEIRDDIPLKVVVIDFFPHLSTSLFIHVFYPPKLPSTSSMFSARLCPRPYLPYSIYTQSFIHPTREKRKRLDIVQATKLKDTHLPTKFSNTELLPAL